MIWQGLVKHVYNISGSNLSKNGVHLRTFVLKNVPVLFTTFIYYCCWFSIGSTFGVKYDFVLVLRTQFL